MSRASIGMAADHSVSNSPDGDAAQQRAPDGADAAENRGDERLQPELEAAGEAEAAELHHHQRPGEAGERAGQGERRDEEAGAVDPEEARRHRVVRDRRARPARRR